MPNYLADCTCKILHVQIDYRPLMPEFKGERYLRSDIVVTN